MCAACMKIGTDICSVTRIRNAYEKHGQRLLNRILTATEQEYIKSRSGKNNIRLEVLAETLAGRFAAKEAVAKALGTGWNGIHWKEVEITNSESGAPLIILHGRAKNLFIHQGFTQSEISLSHERDYALATVLFY